LRERESEWEAGPRRAFLVMACRRGAATGGVVGGGGWPPGAPHRCPGPRAALPTVRKSSRSAHATPATPFGLGLLWPAAPTAPLHRTAPHRTAPRSPVLSTTTTPLSPAVAEEEQLPAAAAKVYSF